MHAYIDAHVYICTIAQYACISMHVHANRCRRMHMLNAYACMSVHTHAHACMHIENRCRYMHMLDAYACISAHTHAHACMHIDAYTCTCMYACISMHTHAHTCMHMIHIMNICMHYQCISMQMHANACTCMQEKRKLGRHPWAPYGKTRAPAGILGHPMLRPEPQQASFGPLC